MEQSESCVDPIIDELHRIRRLLNEAPLTLQDFEVDPTAIGGKGWNRVDSPSETPQSSTHGSLSVVFPAVCRREQLQDVQLVLKVVLDPETPNLTIQRCKDPSHDIEKLPLHENVCSILGHFRVPVMDFRLVSEMLRRGRTRDLYGRHVLVLVFLRLGRDLQKTLKKMKEGSAPTDPAFIATLCRDLIAGVHHLNSYKFIHRDIKADNIFVRRSGGKDRFVIADLGAVWDGNGSLGLRFAWDSDKISMKPKGADDYHAPEVARISEANKDGEIMDWSRQDCWGVGWVLYQAITGDDEPFGGKFGSNVKSDDDFIDFEVPDELKHVKKIVRELLRVDPEKRLTLEDAMQDSRWESWKASSCPVTKDGNQSNSCPCCSWNMIRQTLTEFVWTCG